MLLRSVLAGRQRSGDGLGGKFVAEAGLIVNSNGVNSDGLTFSGLNFNGLNFNGHE